MTTDMSTDQDKDANKTSARNADARTDIQPTPRENRDARNAGEDANARYAEGLADYLLTRGTPWIDEATMREAVREVVGVMLASDAAYDTARLLPGFALRDRLGRADWIFDDELDMHIPACSRPHGRWRCGNGPLDPDRITSGDCGEAARARQRSTIARGRMIG